MEYLLQLVILTFLCLTIIVLMQSGLSNETEHNSESTSHQVQPTSEHQVQPILEHPPPWWKEELLEFRKVVEWRKGRPTLYWWID